ncbi:MAG: hypothetical protein Q8O83_02375 [bacterium]|nr:hypothetical protein [bacterium]
MRNDYDSIIFYTNLGEEITFLNGASPESKKPDPGLIREAKVKFSSGGDYLEPGDYQVNDAKVKIGKVYDSYLFGGSPGDYMPWRVQDIEVTARSVEEAVSAYELAERLYPSIE